MPEDPAKVVPPEGVQPNATGGAWDVLKQKIASEGNVLLETSGSDEESISVDEEITSPAKEEKVTEPEWKDPEGWEQHYYPRDPSALKTALRADAKIFGEVFGDPISEKDHPLHRPFADTQTAYQQARERLTELERVVASIPLPSQGSPEDDDPMIGKFGGITADDVGQDSTIFPEYERAKSAYYNRQEIMREQNRMAQADKARVDAEKAEFKTQYPGESVDEIYAEFAPLTDDGKVNPGFKPLTLTDVRAVKLIRQAGGIDAYVQSRVAVAVEKAKADAVKEIAALARKPHLDSGDHAGEVTLPDFKMPRTVAEANALMREDPAGYERYIAKAYPFLRRGQTGT